MGQRHQIYVLLPETKPIARANGKRVIGIHHQWLYGHTAVRMAERFLTFVEAAKQANRDPSANPFVAQYRSPESMLSAIYSCDPDNGYFHDVCVLDAGEPEDPRRGDNNDGITVFDLRGLAKKRGRIAYCFVNFFEDYHGMPMNVPFSARRYGHAYYPDLIPAKREPGRMVQALEDGQPNVPELRVRAFEKLGVRLMTPSELQTAWPEVFPEVTMPALILPELGDHDDRSA